MNYGIYKQTYRGYPIYWKGTYNVDGDGSYRTIADVRKAIDSAILDLDRSGAEAREARILAGAIRCVRHGDMVEVYLPSGPITVPIREYRRMVFTWESQFNAECVFSA